jgi:glycosyltransferase involved in cell wall biosynthesis
MSEIAGRIGGNWHDATVMVVSPAPTHPQDYGNRKRIYRICRILKEAGAKIHFVHYASEHDWRNRLPLSAQKAMMSEWDGYYLVPPTRPLHPDPLDGSHHTADEWWDPALEPTLSWLSDKLRPDMVIVNYTWLSRALDFAPKHALRILDTHDKFSGRKEMLAGAGIAPEFFYTTEPEEAKALDRADIVWAIKDEERQLLRQLTQRPVLTVPHIDPYKPISMRPTAEDPADFELRLGFMGANNSVNFKNLERFLIEAEQVFRTYLAPVRIVVGGTICERLDQMELPFLEKVGWVEDVAEFYQTVDAAIIPMEFSTGLKIKTAEAMSFGLPILSHAHAFEGYQPTHPFHALGSFRALALACVDLAFELQGLEALRVATSEAYSSAVSVVAEGLAETSRFLHSSHAQVLICLSPETTRRRSLHAQIARTNIEYISACCPVIAYLDAVTSIEGTMAIIQGSIARKVFLNPSIRPTLSKPDIARLEDAGCAWATLQSIVDQFAVGAVWLDHLPRERFPTAPVPSLRHVYVNFALMPATATCSDIAATVRTLAGPETRIAIVAEGDTPFSSTLRAALGAERLAAPAFWPAKFDLIWQFQASDPAVQFGLNVIAHTRDDNAVELLADLARLGKETRINVIEIDRDDERVERHYSRGCDYRYFSRRALESPKRDLLRQAKLTVNLAHHSPFAALLASIFDTSGHHVVNVYDNGEFRLDRTLSSGLLSFIETVHAALQAPPASRSIAAIRAAQMRHDPGWINLCSALSRL